MYLMPPSCTFKNDLKGNFYAIYNISYHNKKILKYNKSCEDQISVTLGQIGPPFLTAGPIQTLLLHR